MRASSSPSLEPDARNVSAPEHEQLLKRVLDSAEFRRSARLRDFLQYVGERALRGATHIQEQEIGLKVFERRPDYDTSLDNIVRVNATLLRRRLEQYFAGEGAAETIVIEIAKGGYVPTFVGRNLVQEPPPAEVDPSQAEPTADPTPEAHLPVQTLAPPSEHRPFLLKWVSAAALLLLVACLFLLIREHRQSAAAAPLASSSVRDLFWHHLLRSPRQTDLVLGDTSFALVQDLLKRQIPLKEFVNQHYNAEFPDPAISPALEDSLRVISSRNNGSMAEFRFARELIELDPTDAKLHVLSAREFNASSMAPDNLILVGSQKANPWVRLFDERLNFAIQDDFQSGISIVNRHPREGEPLQYTMRADPSVYTGYCLIAYLRNAEDTGEVLILQGSGSEETQAAGDFLVSEPEMKHLAEKLGQKELSHFEVLLKTRKLLGAPLTSEVVAYRVY